MSSRKRNRQTSATTDDEALPSLESSEQGDTDVNARRRSSRTRVKVDAAAIGLDGSDPALLKQQTRALFANTSLLPPSVSSTSPLSASSLSRYSVRQLPVDVYAIAHYLGRKVPIVNGGAVKGGVIAALSGTVPFSTDRVRDGHTPLPAFNRMCGINEWANAVCLFVNVKHNTSCSRRYDNAFTWNKDKSACTISWFASPRQTEQTRVIQRLIKSRCYVKREIKAEVSSEQTTLHSAIIKQEHVTAIKSEHSVKLEPKIEDADIDGDGEADTSEPVADVPTAVLLFCRLPQSPYVFCGSLSYVEHDAASSPVKFIWRLDDAAMLQHCADFNQLSD